MSATHFAQSLAVLSFKFTEAADTVNIIGR